MRLSAVHAPVVWPAGRRSLSILVLCVFAAALLTACGSGGTTTSTAGAGAEGVRTVRSACAGPGMLVGGRPPNNAAFELYAGLRRPSNAEDRRAAAALAAGVRDGTIRTTGSVYPDTTRVLHPAQGPGIVLALARSTASPDGPDCRPGRGTPAICTRTACGFPAHLLRNACRSVLTFPPNVDRITGLAPDGVTSIFITFANRAIRLRVQDNAYNTRSIRRKELTLDTVTWKTTRRTRATACR